MSCEGVDIFNLTFHDFEYLDDETALTASRLLHDDDNLVLIRNKKVKYYTLTAKVLVKIVFNNLLPKSGAYNHVRGCTLLLIYCLLKSIKVNISRLIVDFMLSEHLLIPSRNLSFGMILTRLFKKTDLSSERDIAPSVNINSTLLKRIQAGARVHAPAFLFSLGHLLSLAPFLLQRIHMLLS